MRLQRTFHSIDLFVGQKIKGAAAFGGNATSRTCARIVVKNTLSHVVSVKNRRNARLLSANWHFARKTIANLSYDAIQGNAGRAAEASPQASPRIF